MTTANTLNEMVAGEAVVKGKVDEAAKKAKMDVVDLGNGNLYLGSGRSGFYYIKTTDEIVGHTKNEMFNEGTDKPMNIMGYVDENGMHKGRIVVDTVDASNPNIRKSISIGNQTIYLDATALKDLKKALG